MFDNLNSSCSRVMLCSNVLMLANGITVDFLWHCNCCVSWQSNDVFSIVSLFNKPILADNESVKAVIAVM